MSANIAIRPLLPGASPAERAAVHNLVVQPVDPWFSAVERRHFEGALRGEFATVAHDRFWVAWNGGQPVAHVYCGAAADAPEMGLLGFMITAPEYRGRGIGRRLLAEALTDFVAFGGRCVHLATTNPTARRVYESGGFRGYSGHIMRFLSEADEWESFDASYFAGTGPAHIRPANWGDSARIVMLYTTSHPWLVRDYPEHLYNHPAIVQTRCASIPPALLVATGGDRAPQEARPREASGFWVLEDEARRIAGAATLTSLDDVAQAHAPLLDFLVVPGYLGDASSLVDTAVGAARVRDARRIRACVAGCDAEKAAVLLAAGFACEATLPGQLAAGGDTFDLRIYGLVLD